MVKSTKSCANGQFGNMSTSIWTIKNSIPHAAHEQLGKEVPGSQGVPGSSREYVGVWMSLEQNEIADSSRVSPAPVLPLLAHDMYSWLTGHRCTRGNCFYSYTVVVFVVAVLQLIRMNISAYWKMLSAWDFWVREVHLPTSVYYSKVPLGFPLS